ncbi:DUF6653 family protein [Halospeciosus flavus]|uniref:DUF6653 family protein n=1 Tax=Halospeciosus flavus TaxID=3032283 RepID=A0ABD5Z4W2_9EURY|nr:DUF6653 family protein [Halospeciosus flavus]
MYTRRWRLLVAALVFAVVNPVLFSPPADESAWMTRVVYAEEAWTAAGRPLFGAGYPEALNALNVPTFGYALYAAARRKPRRAALATAVSMALKFWFVGALVRWYDDERVDASERADA